MHLHKITGKSLTHSNKGMLEGMSNHIIDLDFYGICIYVKENRVRLSSSAIRTK